MSPVPAMGLTESTEISHSSGKSEDRHHYVPVKFSLLANKSFLFALAKILISISHSHIIGIYVSFPPEFNLPSCFLQSLSQNWGVVINSLGKRNSGSLSEFTSSNKYHACSSITPSTHKNVSTKTFKLRRIFHI